MYLGHSQLHTTKTLVLTHICWNSQDLELIDMSLPLVMINYIASKYYYTLSVVIFQALYGLTKGPAYYQLASPP